MKLVLIVCCVGMFGLMAPASASVIVDDKGVGFVGKGDVQSVYDWNNSQLQQNAALVQFRFAAAGVVSWQCEWWTGPTHNRKYHTVTESTEVLGSSISLDPRKNKQGQITGFTLDGIQGEPTNYTGIGACDGNKTLVVDSITGPEGRDDPLLEVSIDNQVWHELRMQ
jgi:hypothetical protein